MLNIPDEVKALFQSDSIFKNFHVHFPNGEHTDLNNGNIVAESVEFTESLCSQESFRFGLTEASELKFTCVNVPNIRGVTLEAAIEIDVATLGAAWISAHQPSGAEAFLDPQVCTYSGRDLYRVPYGVFIVDTCPRNHETMYKRDVTAYTERLTDTLVNPYQTNVLNAFYATITTYKARTKALAYASIYNSNPDALLSLGYTKTALSVGSNYNRSTTLTLKTAGGVSKSIGFSSAYRPYAVSSITTDWPTTLYAVNWNTVEDPDAVEEVVAILEDAGIDAAQSGYSSLEEIAEEGLQGIRGHCSAVKVDAVKSGVTTTTFSLAHIPAGVNLIYPYIEGMDGLELWFVSKTTVYDGGTILGSVDYGNVTFSKYTDTNAASTFSTMEVAYDSTLQTKRKYDNDVFDFYSFANAFSLSGLVSGYLELLCRFGSPARTGGMEITGLDNTSPVSILPGNYSELWYDETTISPIGYALVKFKGSDGNEQDITVQIGTGSSVYDLTENEVIRNTVFTVSDAEAAQGITIESKIIDFLNTVFTPNIPDMSFVPIELTKQGLPYLEAGDAIEITTGDLQTVPSFILRQTISGIQFLTADVESANGEAIEVLT